MRVPNHLLHRQIRLAVLGKSWKEVAAQFGITEMQVARAKKCECREWEDDDYRFKPAGARIYQQLVNSGKPRMTILPLSSSPVTGGDQVIPVTGGDQVLVKMTKATFNLLVKRCAWLKGRMELV